MHALLFNDDGEAHEGDVQNSGIPGVHGAVVIGSTSQEGIVNCYSTG